MRKPPKIISILVLVSFLTYPVSLHAELPQGGVVVSGSANMDYSQPGTLNINVGANQNIANWQSYSVGSGNAVNYNRDSAFTFLNRVVGSDPSQIFGSINAANGKIFLINQSGILFAPGSSVNAAGLTASTLDIRDADFLAGRYTFFGKGGAVVSQGYISAPGGYVALLGSTVENAGVIEANLGKVILASGERITLGLDAADLISVVIDEATSQNLTNKDAAVHNIGKIKADGGKVVLTAKTLDGVFKQAANNSGVIEAKSLVSKKGEVYLLGNMENDTVANTGKIDVSASAAGVDGGFVELSAHEVDFVSGIIDNRSASGKTGSVVIDPWDFTIDNATASYLENSTFGNYTIEALNNVNFSISDNLLNLYNYGSGEYFKVLAGRDINFNNDSITTQGADIILNADKDFWYKSGPTYPKQWVNTADGDGSINLGSGTLRSNGGAIELKAGKDINLGSGSIRSSGGKVTLVADASFSYDAQPATDDGYSVWHNGYWVPGHYEGLWIWRHWVDGYFVPGYWEVVSLPVLGAAGKTNTSDGFGDINLGNGSGIITNGGAADLSAVNIYATEDILTSGGLINLKATKDIEVKGDLNAGAGQAILNAGDDIFLKNYADIIAGTADLTAGDELRLDDYAQVTVGDPLKITVGGNMTIDDHAVIEVNDRLLASVGGNFTMNDYGAIKAGSADIYAFDTFMNHDSDIDVRGIFNINAHDMIMRNSADLDANIVNIIASRDFLMYDSSDIGDDRETFSTYINVGRDAKVSNSSIYSDFATIIAGDDIHLGKIFSKYMISLDAGDDILDDNGSDINLTTDDLFMVAGETIGEPNASIETNVNDIWATANNGDVWLIEQNGVNLQDIQALGSTVNIVTGGDTNSYNVYASGSGLWDPAIVNLTVNHGELNVLGNGIMASHSGEGAALVNLTADGDINAGARILTYTGSGRFSLSKIDLNSRWDDINIYNGNGNPVQALVYGYGHAEVKAQAHDDINICNGSTVAASAGSGPDTALVNMHAGDDINIKNSFVRAEMTDDGHAEVNLNARDDVNIINSHITAYSGSSPLTSLIDIHAWDDINLWGSTVDAIVGGYGHAEVKLMAWDDVNVGSSSIYARSGGGLNTALVDIDAWDDINIFHGSDIEALMFGEGHAEVNLRAWDDVNIDNSSVIAQTGFGFRTALVQIHANDDINIKNKSTVQALVNNSGNATVNLYAGDNILVSRSTVKSEVEDWGKATNNLYARDIIITKSAEVKAKSIFGDAKNYLFAGEDITLNRGTVKAETFFGKAENSLNAGDDINLTFSKVLSKAIFGMAKVALDARDDIKLFFSNLTAKVSVMGHAEATLDAGSRWNHRGDITLIGSDILAKVGQGLTSALVVLDATGMINLTFSTVEAINNNFGRSSVYFNAGKDINLFASKVTARTGFGNAVVDLDARDDINVTFSKILAKAIYGTAKVVLDAKDDISLFFSNLTAKVKGNFGRAEVVLEAGSKHNHHGDITISNSEVTAKVKGVGHAEVNLEATDDIDIKHSSKILAKTGFGGGIVTDISTALITLLAGDDINLSPSSKIKAISHNWTPAAVLALAGDDINAYGKISAISDYGLAGVGLLALDNIYAGNVLARGNSFPDAIGILENLVSHFWNPVRIERQFDYSSGILLGSLGGDITLGLLRADAVIAAALGGSIYDATNIAEAVIGDVHAQYLGMLARYDIGTALNPIRTFVDIVSAYSWDIGDIYINNLASRPLQLGLYLPIFGISMGDREVFDTLEGPVLRGLLALPEFVQIGAVGASVAANNGIIHVTSIGDMVVNSVISPRGGVFLETTNGSIYAGRGWCPVVSQDDLDNAFGSGESFLMSLAQGVLMDMSGTAWNTVAGVDYFTPLMGVLQPYTYANDLPLGPNVIAGGYSYFSAPNGSIGVGALNNPAVGLFDNPLMVDIQVLTENLAGNNSALPDGIAAAAGLTLKIGGGQGLYNDGFNGDLPVSGVIGGLVRPGVTMNGVFPSPALDFTDPSITTGYVFYGDTSTAYGDDCPGCSVTLDGSSVRDLGLEQIYPNIPQGNLINQLAIDPRIRNIYHPSFRTVSIDRQTPTGTYFYHPLMLSDSSAFDGIALSAAAYDFIDGNLGLKGNLTFSPFYQADNGKKKGKGKS